MKLYECERNTKVRLLEVPHVPPDAPELKVGDIVDFHHIDGMYSYATVGQRVVHLAAWTEVEPVTHVAAGASDDSSDDPNTV